LQKGFNIKKFFIVFILLLTSVFSAELKYDSFILKQIEHIDKLNKKNISQNTITRILKEQKHNYSNALENIMSNKQQYIDDTKIYDTKIFALEKMIKINTRANDIDAVLRDEVQVKSYKVLQNQNVMIRNILQSLNHSDNPAFIKKLNEHIAQNKSENELLKKVDYKPFLELENDSKIFGQVKQNIHEFYAILDINVDLINFLFISEQKIYRLNKYSKYYLINPVLFVNNTQISGVLNPVLEDYSLNVVKLLSILCLTILIYLIKKILYYIFEKNITNNESSRKYSKDILHVMKKPLGKLIFLININMVFYVYNDFNSVELIAKAFNMMYAVVFTYVLYRIINVIAKIKVHELENINEKIKNDVINVGIKILNFIILILGILVVLHLAGANLTAVLSGLGLGGFAVALAAKDSLANFFGTLSILFSDVFAQGDWIVVDNKEGVVIEIGTRVTTLRTFDNALIAIPNAILANQGVKNWNKRNLGRRIKMKLGVTYGASSENIKNAVNEIRLMLDTHEDIATENTAYNYSNKRSAKLVSKADALGIKKTLLVYLDEFSDSSINILVYCFTKSTKWQKWLETKEDVMYKIMEIFERNNLEFAFPSLSIYNETEKENKPRS